MLKECLKCPKKGGISEIIYESLSLEQKGGVSPFC